VLVEGAKEDRGTLGHGRVINLLSKSVLGPLGPLATHFSFTGAASQGS